MIISSGTGGTQNEYKICHLIKSMSQLEVTVNSRSFQFEIGCYLFLSNDILCLLRQKKG